MHLSCLVGVWRLCILVCCEEHRWSQPNWRRLFERHILGEYAVISIQYSLLGVVRFAVDEFSVARIHSLCFRLESFIQFHRVVFFWSDMKNPERKSIERLIPGLYCVWLPQDLRVCQRKVASSKCLVICWTGRYKLCLFSRWVSKLVVLRSQFDDCWKYMSVITSTCIVCSGFVRSRSSSVDSARDVVHADFHAALQYRKCWLSPLMFYYCCYGSLWFRT